MIATRKLKALSAASVLVFLMATFGFAQDAPPEDSQPVMARASLVQGNVSFQRGDNAEWVALVTNTPLTVGDNIATGPGGSAEIELDYANVVRLAPGANIRIGSLSPGGITIQLADGLIGFSVLRPSEAQVEIDTPNAAVHPLGSGNYRVVITQAGETQVTAWNFAADVITSQGVTRLERQQSAVVRGSNPAQFQMLGAVYPDEFDRWNSDRDRLMLTAGSLQHTNRYYEGSYDLDAYGRWSDVPDYGQVWVPSVAAGWVPYRDGRWVWEPFYGWTWVSYEPWGWAPYHYGRWFVNNGSWAWWPGPIVRGAYNRPRWAPAYVSFFGFGGSVGVGVSFGNIGWLPVGPSDRFFPWYGRYGKGVNYWNATNLASYSEGRLGGLPPLARAGMHPYSNVREAMNNDSVRRGASFMAAGEFGRARVAVAQRPVDRAEFSRASFVAGTVPISPGRASFRVSDRAVITPTSRSWSAPRSAMAGEANRGQTVAPESRGYRASPEAGWRSSAQGPSGGMSRGGFQQQGGFVPNKAGVPLAAGAQPQIRGGYARSEGPQSFSPQPPYPQGTQQTGRPEAMQGGRQSFRPDFQAPQRSGAPEYTPQRNFLPSHSEARPSRPQLDLRQPIVRERSEGGRQGGGSQGRSPQSGGGGGRSRGHER